MQHVDLLAEGLGDGLLGPQVDVAEVAVDEDRVAVQRLAGDARRMDHERDRERAGDDRRVAPDRALLEHHAAELAAVVEQLARPDVARDEDRVLGQLAPGRLVVAGEQPQQPVRRSSRSCSRSRR